VAAIEQNIAEGEQIIGIYGNLKIYLKSKALVSLCGDQPCLPD
jgi:hypothetical protein